MLTDEAVPTRNQTGWSARAPHEINLAFAKFASSSTLPVLDIGAGFGAASIEVLRRGANLIVNDAAAEQIAHIRSTVEQLCLPAPQFVLGEFPGDLDFPSESLGAVHSSNVLHFLTPEEFEIGIRKIHSWLAPSGKIFLLTSSPFQGHLRNCGAVFDKRKQDGAKWPGWFEDVKQMNSGPLLDLIPNSMLFFDVETLSDQLVSVGFTIEEGRLYSRSGIPDSCRLDGRENLFLIGRKK
jgi:SAM-dependent methyltransferase